MKRNLDLVVDYLVVDFEFYLRVSLSVSSVDTGLLVSGFSISLHSSLILILSSKFLLRRASSSGLRSRGATAGGVVTLLEGSLLFKKLDVKVIPYFGETMKFDLFKVFLKLTLLLMLSTSPDMVFGSGDYRRSRRTLTDL